MTLQAGILALLVLTGQFNLDRKIEIPDWENSVAFELVASQQPVRPGDALELAVIVAIQPGYHLYGPEEPEPSRTKVTLAPNPALSAKETVYPEWVRRDLEGLGEYDLYEGEIAFRVPVEASRSLSGGVDASVEVEFQVCTDFACSAPNSKTLTLSLDGAEAGAPVKKLHSDIFSSK